MHLSEILYFDIFFIGSTSNAGSQPENEPQSGQPPFIVMYIERKGRKPIVSMILSLIHI